LEIGGPKFHDEGPLIDIKGLEFLNEGGKLANEGPKLEIGCGVLREDGLELEMEDKTGSLCKFLPTRKGMKVLRPCFPKSYGSKGGAKSPST